MRFPTLALGLLLCGCAGTTVRPIAYGVAPDPNALAGADDSKVNGFRYYEGANFLIVYSDGKGGLKSEVKFLPDVTQKRAIDPYAWFAKNDTTLTFTNGMLTQSKSTVDEAVLPKAVISAASKMALATIAAANEAAGQDAAYLPAPVIYKIRIAGDGKLLLVKGVTNVDTIEVTLQEPDK